jgi:exonuclease SbcC
VLESLTVRNFQKHRNLNIEFGDGVTTIVGPSDRGKSAVIRALRWALLNDRRGDRFIRKGMANCRVQVQVDSHSVTRKKGPGKNTYSLDGKVYKAFGTGKVPDDIADLLNVGENNFQKQISLPFWFTDSPGQVSKKLNQIVNLELIDRTFKNVSDQLRKAKVAVEVTEERLDAARTEEESLKWAVSFHKDAKKLLRLHKRHSALAIKCSRIASLLSDVSRLNLIIGRRSKAILDADKVIGAGRTALDSQRRVTQLSELVGQIKKADNLVRSAVPDISELQNIRVEADNVAENRRDLEYLLGRLQEHKTCLSQIKEDLRKAESDLKKVKVKRCPKCKQTLPSKQGSSAYQYPTSTSGRKLRSPVRVKLPGTE